MRILFVSNHNPHYLTLTEYVENAIRKLGHDLYIYDDRKHIIPGRIRKRIAWLDKLDLNHINRKLLSYTSRVKPEIMLVAWGTRILPETVRTILNWNVCTVLWTVDAPIDFTPLITAGPYYNYIFCGGTEAMEILANAGIKKTRWLPFACDPEYHHRVELSVEDKKKYGKDVVFFGSYYPNRWNLLKELREFNLGIWGPYWERAEKLPRVENIIKDVKLQPDEWVKLFSAAPIVIVIHYQDGKNSCYQASPKIYEALACGCFVLTDRQKDVFSSFRDKKHLVSFDDVEDLKEKIRYYLLNPSKRQKIAECGKKEVLSRHTYYHRIENLLKIVIERGIKQ